MAWRKGSPLLGEESGQSTTEYALVLVAFLAMLGALGLLWHAASDGVLLGKAVESASHVFGASGSLGAWQDILLF